MAACTDMPRPAHRPILLKTRPDRMFILDLVFGFIQNHDRIKELRAGRIPIGLHAVELRRAQLEKWLADGGLDDDAIADYRAKLAELADTASAVIKFSPEVEEEDCEYVRQMIVNLTPMAAKNRNAASLMTVKWMREKLGVTVEIDYIRNFYKKKYPGGVIRTPAQWAEFKRRKSPKYLPPVVSTFF